MNISNSKALIAFILAMSALSVAGAATSDILMTIQNSGVYNTTLSGGTVQNFDGLSSGLNNNVTWSGVGTIDHLMVQPNSDSGGASSASKTPAMANLGSQATYNGSSALLTTTIKLNTASSYFGMYWGSMDAPNTISFYKSGDLVGSIRGGQVYQSMKSDLSSASLQKYMGNPAAPYQWANATEAFAFVNFTGAAGTSWDTIVLDDTYGKGFETDNWTSRVNGWNPSKDASLPGTVIADLTTQGGNTTVAAVTSATLNPSGQLVLQNGGKFVSNFVPSAPGAPAPPMAACLAFAGVLLFQALRRRSVA